MTWLIAILLVYLLILLLVAKMSVSPFRLPLFISPGALGTPQEDVEFVSGDGTRLAGWWIGDAPEARQNPVVVVLAHGYMMNRSEPSPLAATLWQAGYPSLLFDFRAHGRSTGRRCGFGWTEQEDVIAAIKWVRSRHPDSRIVLWGSSMGGAACAFAAARSRDTIAALVLDSAYSRLSQSIGGWWEFLGGRWLRVFLAPTPLLSGLFLNFSLRRVDVAAGLAQIPDIPVLILHGRADLLARPEQAERNLAACGRGKIAWYEGCGHSEARWNYPQEYRRELLAFLESARNDSPESDASS